MDKNWVQVFEGTFLPLVEMYKAALETNNIPALIFNQQDSVHKTFGEIKLYVNKDDLLKALQIISTQD